MGVLNPRHYPIGPNSIRRGGIKLAPKDSRSVRGIKPRVSETNRVQLRFKEKKEVQLAPVKGKSCYRGRDRVRVSLNRKKDFGVGGERH